MEILVVTLAECAILGVLYVFFNERAKKSKETEDEKRLLLHNFYKQEMAHIETLQLAGTGSDGNGYFEFGQAVKKNKVIK